jgi:hypothetical protein
MQVSPLSRLVELERGARVEAALALFDSLPAVAPEAMLGAWRGHGLPTGHPFDGFLERLGWHGKRFDSTEDAHPLVFRRGDGSLYSLDPSRIPLALAIRCAGLLRRPLAASIGKRLTPLLRTGRPKARLRSTEFRGVVSATMIYDTLPILDVFRRVDRDTLLGVMDLRGAPFFVFTLRREP